jgi:hypothetical protein
MSTLKADTIVASDGSSPVTLTKQSAAKAWLNLNGTGTIAARDSFNISSTSDISTGIYTATVINSFSDANFAYSISSGWTSGGQGVHQEVHEDRITSSVLGIGTMNTSNAAADSANIFSSAHGDLS